jgi:beta-phosphoglucomutase
MSQTHPMTMKRVPTLNTLKATYPGLKTILFDMDGTLFDTEKYHTLALQSIRTEQKITPPLGPKELHELMMGKADHLLFELIKDWPGFPEHWDVEAFVNEKNRHFLKILGSIAGDQYFSFEIKNLLIESRSEGIKTGLVTSSEKIVTTELLRLAETEHLFSYILTRDDSLRVKPDPWPYLTAMEYFETSPEETLIFEDSHVGLEAAHRSLAHVIKAAWY